MGLRLGLVATGKQDAQLRGILNGFESWGIANDEFRSARQDRVGHG